MPTCAYHTPSKLSAANPHHKRSETFASTLLCRMNSSTSSAVGGLLSWKAKQITMRKQMHCDAVRCTAMHSICIVTLHSICIVPHQKNLQNSAYLSPPHHGSTVSVWPSDLNILVQNYMNYLYIYVLTEF